MTGVEVVRVDHDTGLARVHRIRFDVFVEEQGVTVDEELDDLDNAPGTVHLLAVDTDTRADAPAGAAPAGAGDLAGTHAPAPAGSAVADGNRTAAGADDAAAPARDLGTLRVVSDPDHPGAVHVTRVAVRASARRRGVGRALMDAAEALALAEHAAGDPPTVRVELSVQETALAFYEALGYEIGTRRYLDARMWHRDALKVLTR